MEEVEEIQSENELVEPETVNDQEIIPHVTKWTAHHPISQIIGDLSSLVRTRSATANECKFSMFLSATEPTEVSKALEDSDWVKAMQEELNQFEALKVWRLVPKPKDKSIIGTKWIFMNKVLSTDPFLKLDLSKYVDNSSYHALGACFNPYSALSNI